MKNKNVLITGGSKGLGKEMAIRFARNGANVVINYYHDDAVARETVEIVSKFGTKVELLKADVGVHEEMVHLCRESIRKMGNIDVFIHNAVNGIGSDLLSISPELWKQSFQTNLDPLLIGAQELVPLMKQNKWGRIFAISSRGSQMAVPNYSPLGVPKAAMEALIRYMAVEFGPFGITANSISAGTMDTEVLKKINKDAKRHVENSRNRVPAYRPMEIEDVANVICNMCSNEMEMINGQVIRVDGGLIVKA